MADLEVTRKFQKELNAGVSALLVLGLLVKADRPMYGYEIAMQLEGMSEEGLPMNHGALYPVLRSLERSRLLSSHMAPSVAGPPRRYYAPTDSGRLGLAQWHEAWQRTSTIVTRVLEKTHDRRSRRPQSSPEVS
jgi:PadR family transcriptional regulator PadR